jgi:signal transduction histidine kinase
MRAWFQSLRYSLSTRLMLLFLAGALAILLVIAIGFRIGIASHFQQQLKPHLLAYLDYVQRDLGSPPDPRRAAKLAAHLPLDIHLQGPGLDWSSGSALGDQPGTPDFDHQHGRWAVAHTRDRLWLRTHQDGYAITYEVQSRPDPRATPLRLMLFAAVLLILGLLYLLIRRLFRPIQTIRDGVRAIGDGQLSTRIVVSRPNKPDELSELTTNINQMATDLQGLLEAKRTLLLAISHELRSPLTRARVSLELLEQSPGRERITADLQTMNRLIHELLEVERLDSRHAALQRESVNPAELIQALIAEDFAGQRIATRLAFSGQLSLDATRIRLLLRNLLDNAIRHTATGQPAVQLLLSRQQHWLRIEVHSHGAAIPAASDRAVLSRRQRPPTGHRRLWAWPLPVPLDRQGTWWKRGNSIKRDRRNPGNGRTTVLNAGFQVL